MKTIFILIGLVLTVNTFAVYQLKSGVTYTDEYGLVHDSIYAIVEKIEIEDKLVGNSMLRFEINFYVSEQAFLDGYKALKTFSYTLTNVQWTIYWNANPRVQNIRPLLETWAINNVLEISSLLEVVP